MFCWGKLKEVVRPFDDISCKMCSSNEDAIIFAPPDSAPRTRSRQKPWCITEISGQRTLDVLDVAGSLTV